MEVADNIVSTLLEDEAEEFMADVGFDPNGDMYVLGRLNVVKDDIKEFGDAVLRRTREIMPALVKRGIVQPDRAPLIAKFMAFHLANEHYDPKLYGHDSPALYRRMKSVMRADMPWGKFSHLAS